MFLVSLGVYALIFPLERKLQLIHSGITKVREGKLNTKVKVVGEDEIAHLAATFNSMTEHIRRLIESQRELTRAVSHELRTPVARIRFAVDMLADTDDYDDRMSQRDYIDQGQVPRIFPEVALRELRTHRERQYLLPIQAPRRTEDF